MAAEDEQTQPAPPQNPPAGFVANLKRSFGALPIERRRLILGASAAAFIGLVAIIVTSQGGDDYITIKSDLAPEDEAAAVAALDEQKIPHRLGARGSIEVPRAQLHNARLAVELVTGSGGRTVGYEIFNDPPMGLSSQGERLNRHRALEGEISRSISQIEGIQHARVHVVLPKRRPFKSMDVAPSASVMLKLDPGASITHNQTRAIRQLVASAVERLEPKAISIVDDRGVMLASPEDDELHSGVVFEQQHELEEGLATRVVALLEPVIGHGNVQAQVALDMDFSRVVETSETFDPESQVVRSEREKTEKKRDSRDPVGGPPGTASNLPDRTATPPGGAATLTSTDTSDVIKNYDISKNTVRRERPTARVQRMTVSVMLNERPNAEGTGTVAYTPEELSRFEQIVSNAVGLDSTRGDKITVTGERFMPVEGFGGEEVAAPPVGITEETLRLILIGAGAFVLLLLLLIVFLIRRRRRRREEAKRLAAKKAAEAASLELVVDDDVMPFEEEEPDWEHEVLRKQIRRLRDRAVRLGQEDIRQLVVVFESWFDQVHIHDDEAGEGEHEGESSDDDKAAA